MRFGKDCLTVDYGHDDQGPCTKLTVPKVCVSRIEWTESLLKVLRTYPF